MWLNFFISQYLQVYKYLFKCTKHVFLCEVLKKTEEFNQRFGNLDKKALNK